MLEMLVSDKHSSSLDPFVGYAKRSVGNTHAGPNVIKLFTDVIYAFLK